MGQCPTRDPPQANVFRTNDHPTGGACKKLHTAQMQASLYITEVPPDEHGREVPSSRPSKVLTNICRVDVGAIDASPARAADGTTFPATNHGGAISVSTGPYSPDQDGPPDKTSGVEASCYV